MNALFPQLKKIHNEGMVLMKTHRKILLAISIILLIIMLFFVIKFIIHRSETPTSDITSETRVSIHNTTNYIKNFPTHTHSPENQETTTKNITTMDDVVVIKDTDEEIEKEQIEPNLQTTYYTEQDVVDIAKVLYTECRGLPTTEQACVAWVVLNRVDNYDSTVYSVVRAPGQFAFSEYTPVTDELFNLASDVLDRWSREKNGEENVGRVLPKEFTFFEGYGGHNHFRDKYEGSYNIWDYSLESPYEN